jgi:hypothetical protein
MSNLTSWAKKELKDYQQRTGKSIEGVDEIMSAFSAQGHSGFSAGYALSFINSAVENGYEVVEKQLDAILESSKQDKDEVYGDGMQQSMTRDIKETLNLFKKYNLGKEEAHLVSRLMNWKPINPLTGEDDEWGMSDNSEGKSQQNKRCSAVFRDNFDNSTAHYIEGKVFSDDGGDSWYTCKDSFVHVTFPFEVPDKPERIILKGAIND